MITVQKWNFKKHCYEEAQIDDSCSLYETDMDKIVKCANYNKDVKFGNCYTSKQYHNHVGFGYVVCQDCYDKEIEQYLKKQKLESEEN